MTSELITYGEAINQALVQSMKFDNKVFIVGLGIDEKNAVYKTTGNLVTKFGKNRVVSGPASEMALTMLCAGASLKNLKPILVHQRVDFMVYTMDQLINWIALWSFKSSGKSKMPLTIRAIIGKGWGQGPQHSKSLHSLFANVPGLEVVMPSSPADAKGLLIGSIFSKNPTIFLESRSLYSMKQKVRSEMYYTEIGKSSLLKKGRDITFVSFGSLVPMTLDAAKELDKIKISAEVIDLRTIKPLDTTLVEKSLIKTKKIIVLEPGWKYGGVAAEISARMSEKIKSSFIFRRITWPDSHTPTSFPLENKYYPKIDDLIKLTKEVLNKK